MPDSSTLSTRIRPSNASTTVRVMASPSPVPAISR
jgi:hypothetical protein